MLKAIFVRLMLILISAVSLLSLGGIQGCGLLYSVGGTITGLSGTIVLENYGGDVLTVTANGTFTFSGLLADGAIYNVTVLTQPAGQTCNSSSNTGKINGTNITNVLVSCTTDNNYTVGGSLSNLGNNESVVLQNNSGDNLTLTSNGSFTFSTPLSSDAPYDVTILTQPSRQNCSVTNGSGTVSSANVTSVAVACVTTNPIFYVTALAHTGDLGGISGADTICMTDTNKPAAGTYKAFLVDGTNRRACATGNCTVATGNNIDWVLAPATTYYRSDGTTPILTTNDAGISIFGTLTNSFLTDGTDYWTGLNSNWTTYFITCSDWTSSSGGDSSSGGTGDAIDSDAIDNFSGGCDAPLLDTFLICVEQ